MPDFEWQIGDSGWEADAPNDSQAEELHAPAPLPASERFMQQRGLHRRAVLVGVLVLGLIATGVMLIVARRVEEATAPIRREVLASYDRLQYALAQSDDAVFASLMSRRETIWARSLQAVFDSGAFFDRSPMGLRAQAIAPHTIDVALSPDLKQAEVVVEQAYDTVTGEGADQTVHLRQTIVYRFENQRWLLSAPSFDFWGEPIRSEGQFVSLVYPTRDEAIGSRLAQDLDHLLARLCGGATGVTCPPDFRLRLRLDMQMSNLADAFNFSRNKVSLYSQVTSNEILLPAPTLVGVPVDEAGYQALYRGYAAQVVRATVLDADGPMRSLLERPEHCEVETHRQLIGLGLRPWPQTGTDLSLHIPPLPLPDQDLALYCLDGPAQGGTLYRYIPATGTWSEETTHRFFMSLDALAGGEGLVVREMTDASAGTSRLVRWQDGREQVLLANAFPPPSGDQSDPTGRRLLVDWCAQRLPCRPALLDLDDCGSEECRVTPLSGWSSWSPDGSQTLLSGAGVDVTIGRGDRAAQSLKTVGQGHQPFWLDDRTYGYMRWLPANDSRPRSEVVIADIDTDEAHKLASSNELLAMLGGAEKPERLDIISADAAPANPDWVLVRALTTSPNWDLYFLISRRSGEISLRLNAGGLEAHAGLSPDGRWLVTTRRDAAQSAWLLELLETGGDLSHIFTLPADIATRSFMFVLDDNWSADGRWLFVLADGVLYLIAPDFDYQRAIVPASPGCVFAAWVDR